MKICPVCGKEYSDTTTLCGHDAAVLKSVDDPLIGETLAGKYLVEDLIKRGGMGAVYRGKHVLMDKTVAIKVLRPSLAVDDAVVARFSREAKAASRISHPHAVSVTDFGESENGVVFLVMEYLDGLTLKDVIRAEGPMALDRVITIIQQVAGALEAAHQQGVVHRDLKSDNIMLSQAKGGDWAKVLDFGIAKIQEARNTRELDLTAPNLVVGTPQYMSPEQCSQSRELDSRSDIYSLGIIVFEMLSGSVPFTGESPTLIMMKQVQDPAPSVLTFRPDLPPSVGNVIARALAKEPQERFQTASEFSDALTLAASSGTAGVAITAANTPVASAPVANTPIKNTPVPLPDDDSEVPTMVRPRDEPLIPARSSGGRSLIATLNPWRVLLPSVLVVIAVFAIVFLLTRGTGQITGPTLNDNGLAADPSSEPVKQTGTPTGAGEQAIVPVPVATPIPTPSAAANATPIATPVVTPDATATPTRNPTQVAPTPRLSPSEDEPPPPKASPTPKPTVKPAVTPA